MSREFHRTLKCLLERRRKEGEEDDVYDGAWPVKVEGGRIMKGPAPRIDM